MDKIALNTLLPKKLEKEEEAYKSVEDLNKVLSCAREERIRNIALTGPFGSGKSSVLITLMEDFTEGREYLPISLATLQGNEDEKSKKELSEVEKEKCMENLNRKIEYSILQQLIYRENVKTVPNSRFRRIVHLSPRRASNLALGGITTLVAFFILFEPRFARVETLYYYLNFGTWNVIPDSISLIWLLYALFLVLKHVINSFCNSKLNKLNLKDGEIEVVENNSIFNRHLDEILYFFQVTKYNVVIIEDLDRFGTPNIYLKLRELNQLINESKIVGRHITFVYAVKDDIFKDEERTKFFDYITTVIPVINPSNSKDKLKKALETKELGEDGIADDDLSEMAFFIQDMRILTNIVNEYQQYRDRLCNRNGQKLNKTKLLAMIVYKNYHPQDFAELHCRQGKVYRCISKKREFISEALKEIESRKKELSEKEQIFLNNLHLQESDLRRLFLFRLRSKTNDKMCQIQIDGHYYTYDKIAESSDLFNKLLSNKTMTYQYYDNNYYNNMISQTSTNNPQFNLVDNEIQYSERLKLLQNGQVSIKRQYAVLQKEIFKIKAFTLKELISKYKLGEKEVYKSLALSPMMDVFIRRGYLDEEYYDYISYFYEGMVSLADRDLLLSIKRQVSQPYEYHIDKIENFVKELRDYMFESDAILNNDLLDYTALHEIYKEIFEHIMYRLECDEAPLQFLAQYYIYGKQQKKIFSHFMDWDNTASWNLIIQWNNDSERETLIEAYLKYAEKLSPVVQEWLNKNFEFLVKHIDGITLKQCLNWVTKSNFTTLWSDSVDLLNSAIEHSSYEITLENLVIIAKHLCNDNSISKDNLNYTRLADTQHHMFIDYITKNIAMTLACLKDANKDESPENIVFILNHTDINISVKEKYLNGQHNQIEDFTQIEDKTMYDIVIKNYLVAPTWENVSVYYAYKEDISEELAGYINHFSTTLSNSQCNEKVPNREEMYISLFGRNILPIKNYKRLLNSFNLIFPECDDLKFLEEERLKILINSDRIPFTEEMLMIMNESKAFAEFIIHHAQAFIQHLDWEYEFTIANASTILQSEKFSWDEKQRIIGIIPSNILQNSQPLADIVVEVLNETSNLNIEENVIICILGIAKNEANKVKLATYLIKNCNNDTNAISNILQALNGNFAEICDTTKSSQLTNTPYNVELLRILQNTQFISSFQEDEDKNYLKIYHD